MNGPFVADDEGRHSVNQVALITGASRGIGRGIALELAKIGFDLVVNYAGNQSAAQETASDCVNAARSSSRRIRAEICQADIGLPLDRERLLDFAKRAFGRLDLLVNNAGITSIGRADILDATEENFDRLMAINLKGPYFLTQRAAKWMIEQAGARRPASEESGQGNVAAFSYRPKIITISSISAYAVSTNRGDYCLAKAALEMLTKLYAARLAEFGINVYEVRPGVIATDMTAPVKEKYDKLIAEGLTPIRRWGTPEDVGKAVAAIAQDLLPFSTGEIINVDGGFHLRRL
ncbi:MAG: 3-ketoacyl-ACP reductase [Verrucomicrobia bacterium]|nr:3-ketoacyl-ACP reductase [Verrucomicrobiota bacterium]